MHALLWMLTACDAEPPPASRPPVAEQAPVAELPPAPMVLPERITARHILVAYQGATNSSTVRTREEALSEAMQLRRRLLAAPDQFDELAVERSDGPTSVLGGHLGSFEPGVMAPAFEEAAFRLPVGGISEVVETPFGFHLIQRLPSEEIKVAHVLVQWKGVHRSDATRSPEEARAIIDEAKRRIASGEPVSDVARMLSDGPSALRGGDLGWFQRGQLVPAFDDAAFTLAPGEASDVVESPLGYHVIVRQE
jgi:parvulin-like peptidyl-prolyl isomerase